MTECHCRVTLTDIEGGSHVVEVKASSLFEAIARALKLKAGNIAIAAQATGMWMSLIVAKWSSPRCCRAACIAGATDGV